MDTYEVIVGNVGNVHVGESHSAALWIYITYADQSRIGYGRASHEDVTLLRNGEIIREHRGNHHGEPNEAT